MDTPYWLKTMALIVPAVLLSPAAARAQLPFDVTEAEVALVDTAQLRWPSLAVSLGGVSGELQYLAEEPSEGECRAVAVLGLLRLRNYYLSKQGQRPVTLNLRLRCGPTYHGRVEYDGIITRFELREGPVGGVIYRDRLRGLP